MKKPYLIWPALFHLTGCIGVGVGTIAETESGFFQTKKPLVYTVEAEGDSKWCSTTNAIRAGQITLSSPTSKFYLTLRPQKNTLDTKAEIWTSRQYGSPAFKLPVEFEKISSSGIFTISMPAEDLFNLVFNSKNTPTQPFDLFFVVSRTRTFPSLFPTPIPSRDQITMYPTQNDDYLIFVLQVNP